MHKKHTIILKKVKVHNLKSVDLELPTHELIVFTGVSGSGKSSLAFDTLYVEGQRRYIESLSSFAKRYIGDMSKPDVEYVAGLSPTIAIEQKSAGKNPRSTVGTLTEIYDYLRVLYARVGVPHCPLSQEPVRPQSSERIMQKIQNIPKNTKILILAPFVKGKKGEFKEDLENFLRKGYTRARIDGSLVDLSDEINLDKNLTHDIDIIIDRLTIDGKTTSRIAEAVIAGLELGQGALSVYFIEKGEETLFSTHAYSPKSGLYYNSLEPQDFSFNSPTGMCPACHGLSWSLEFDLTQVIDEEKSISQDCCSIASSYQTVRYGNIFNNLAEIYSFSVQTPWKKLSEKAKKILLYGTEKKWTLMHFVHPQKKSHWSDYVAWRGIIPEALERYSEAKSDSYRKKMEQWMIEKRCSACHGARIKPYPAATQLNGKKIQEVTSLTIQECVEFFKNLSLDPQELLIAEELLKEITRRLNFLLDVGLHYLTLDRTTPTLSGGEAQRVRLASQVGSRLVGVTYVLDEPSIGLHPRDNKKLIQTLQSLRDIGNTVIVVEHDEETILAADRVVDFGPGPGKLGGEVLVNGTIKELLENPASLTGAYLSGRKTIDIPQTRREPSGEKISISHATHHNLRNLSVEIPLGLFVAVTGVSGSGKSSLISETLYPALANKLHKSELPVGKHKTIEGDIDKIIAIDQSPIGRNPRSNPATYIKILDEIRTLFSALPESVARGYLPGRFSFNVREGACFSCHGMGMVRIDMDFMEDSWIPCTHCKNQRFDSETLSIYYKGKNIHDVLEMTFGEALLFFSSIPHLKKRLETVCAVGMGYLQLGQPSPTLSGGEAQRIKLAKELVRPSSGKTLYILDEPTTGLHFHDIAALLKVLQELVDRGNSVLVIEHNMDVVKTADWVIDLGPEGGKGGGSLVGYGPPEAIAKLPTPTGLALQDALYKKPFIIGRNRKKPHSASALQEIVVVDAEQNNLKNISVTIPRNKMTICTGPSGSGKSSLAFETIYAEGQRRYIESLSPYARQFVKQMPKPKVGHIEGLSPTIAIEQKQSRGNPRSTVGTQTEIYDYLRVLFAHQGIGHDPDTQEVIKSITKEFVLEKILELENEKITLLAPLEIQKNEVFEQIQEKFRRLGFLRLRLNKAIFELDETIAFDRRRKNSIALVIDRIKVSKSHESRLHEAIEQAIKIADNKLVVLRESGEELFFNLRFAVESTGKSYPPITPHTFSFNSPEGMCPDCRGLGFQYGNLMLLPDILHQSVESFFYTLWKSYPRDLFHQVLKKLKITPEQSLKSLEKAQLHQLLQGMEENSWVETKEGLRVRFRGLQPTLALIAHSAHPEVREPIVPLMEEVLCNSCQGARLNPIARNVRIENHSISSLAALPCEKILAFLKRVSLDEKKVKLLEEVLNQLKSRLSFLIEVGLHYLSLDRRAPTLSNGEAQRIRLAKQLGVKLTGVLYVLDEPTIGLHPEDNKKLNRALKELQILGNTLLLVEHDPMTVREGDYFLEFGPGAGVHGGHLIAQGTLVQIEKNPNSLTGKYLSGKKQIPIPKKRRTAKKSFSLPETSIHNLKKLSLTLPLGVLVGFTGVSGSGKSTLMHQVLRPLVEKEIKNRQGVFDKLIVIDQDPLGHTVRSDLGTYVNLLSHLREFYASLALARRKGLQPSHFSYNHRKGMCTACFGLGYKKVEMLFLPPVKIACDVCKGLRLNPSSLEVTYQEKNFGHLLAMSVEQARAFFPLLPKVCQILDTLIACGLGYVTLGQEVISLSTGEAQRIKLSAELAKRSSGKTLYLLDEPTTGLHAEDILKLLTVLQQLVDKGNSMVVIEHNIDVINNCDYLFDIGPGAGDEGGTLVAEGTPEAVAKNPKSLTGRYL